MSSKTTQTTSKNIVWLKKITTQYLKKKQLE
jgi:hypothetical protein